MFDYVADSGLASVTGTDLLTDITTDGAQAGVNATVKYGVTGLPATATNSQTVTAIINSVGPRTTGSVSFRVKVKNFSTPGAIPNVAGVSYDDDNDGTTATTPTAEITGVSNNVDLTVTLAPAVTITDDIKTAAVPQGATVIFKNTVTNRGNGIDTFDITVNRGSFPDGTVFQLFKPNAAGTDGTATLVDSNNNSTPDTGPLNPFDASNPTAPGTSYDMIVKAILPANISKAGPYAATVTATSGGPGKPFARRHIKLPSITAATADITNRDANGVRIDETTAGVTVPVLTRAGIPGTVVTFPLSAQNISSNNDNFSLSYTATPALPAGFSVVFKDNTPAGQVISNTGNIAPNGFFDYIAEVTIPTGATPQDIALVFKITSFRGTTDTVQDKLTVNPVQTISISPNNQGQVFPNSSVNYSHIIKNNGNATESSITVTAVDSLAANGFSSVIYADLNGNGILDPAEQTAGPITPTKPILNLAAGASTPIIVQVFGPSNQFTSGATNVTTVTATSADTAQVVTATDATTIVSGDVVLTKTQSVDGGATFSQANAIAVPGATIRYQVKVRNTGAATVTGIVVTDTTPTFTKYKDAVPASYSIDGGATVTTGVSTPGAGNAGILTWTIPSLAPNAVATVIFDVTIDN